jgi:hypothetical protein
MLVLSKTVVDNIREGIQTAVIKDTPHRGWAVGARHKIYHGHPANGAKAVMDVVILGTTYKKISDITNKDARALGFQGIAEFYANWLVLHEEFRPAHHVWIIHIEKKETKNGQNTLS